MNSLASGARFQIASCQENFPKVGVDYSKTAKQIVRLNEPVNTWTLDRVGGNVYGFSIGGYGYTGVAPEGDIIASIDPEADVKWYVSYEEARGCYTISPDYNDGLGWTISDASGVHPAVQLRPLGRPVRPSQLFRLQVVPPE